ncbi:hypothetical protein ANME2D_01274 [Candidatus Methanoperedens nitroreducens]|uniref:Uncharacterized protein n=1 Tax=Candidatus Methanoperedens nitratireducens TaxID=1392998 RepID=A0A062VAS5_9EURY|nr:hypothetical protein [Candidatus Methanoperedens nitroreducens]KCZ72839.1 hypothetical protein ANME2D_01274 [Candidatus Methanoperedens nitroreducens]MDJ1423230.1 hypothetical protein [Candidatus Methanoperedens sp.]
MNRKIIPVILLIVAFIGAPDALARPEYLSNLTAVYGEGTCGTCHVNPAPASPEAAADLTTYGSSFRDQPNYAEDPSAALMAIGAPPDTTGTPGVTPTPMETPYDMVTPTPVETPEETPEVTPEETPEETPEVTPVETPEETPEETPDEIITPTPTPSAPGFGFIISLAGLLALLFLLKRRN